MEMQTSTRDSGGNVEAYLTAPRLWQITGLVISTVMMGFLANLFRKISPSREFCRKILTLGGCTGQEWFAVRHWKPLPWARRREYTSPMLYGLRFQA